jgi:hypothetical protein
MGWMVLRRRWAIFLLVIMTISLIACSSGSDADSSVDGSSGATDAQSSSNVENEFQALFGEDQEIDIGVSCDIVSTDEVKSITGVGKNDKPVGAFDSIDAPGTLICDWAADKSRDVSDQSVVALAGELVTVGFRKLESDTAVEDHIYFLETTHGEYARTTLDEYGRGAYETVDGRLTRIHGMFAIEISVMIDGSEPDFEAVKSLSELIVSRLP